MVDVSGDDELTRRCQQSINIALGVCPWWLIAQQQCPRRRTRTHIEEHTKVDD